MSKMGAEYQKQREMMSGKLYDIYENGKLNDIAYEWLNHEISNDDGNCCITFIDFLNMRLKL